MAQSYWAVICPNTEAPGLWATWLREKCVAIGWPPSDYHLEGPTEKPGWDIARAHVQRILPGDIVIPYLLRYRFGIPGEVVRVAVADAEWRPTVPKGGYARNPLEAELGRRVEVKWLVQGVPPPDKIAVVPVNMRTSGGEVKHTIEPVRSERYARFMDTISNPANWANYEDSEYQDTPPGSSDEQAEPSTEPEAGKLTIQETLVRSILARNLQRIEAGLKPHPEFNRLEEVTFDLGRLDLLCMDSQGRLTIIELQLGWLDDGHIGKVCRYFGWFAAKHGPTVRAMLLFENASREVLDAYKRALPWLELKKFSLAADIKMDQG